MDRTNENSNARAQSNTKEVRDKGPCQKKKKEQTQKSDQTTCLKACLYAKWPSSFCFCLVGTVCPFRPLFSFNLECVLIFTDISSFLPLQKCFLSYLLLFYSLHSRLSFVTVSTTSIHTHIYTDTQNQY